MSVSLTRRDVRLRVTSDGREALVLSPVRTLRERVAGIWGVDYAARFVDVEGVAGPVRVSGMVERPGDVGTGSRRAFLMVNGRPVREHGVARAVEAAYRSTLPAGLRPSFLLEVTVPADDVDVNVHPAKAEVRFTNKWGVDRAIEEVVQRALGTADAVPWVGRAWSPGMGGAGGSGLPEPTHPPVSVSQEPVRDGLFAAAVDAAPDAPPAPEAAPPIAVPDLMQLRRTYLMYEHEDGVILIDQHSAHERVLYERFLAALERGDAPSQRLLFPETVHLSPEDADAW
ncbi:MAG: hypothetical protein JNL44_16370, partial [Gemmatimonadetes bacterium]|nr:hypothetical protein [Gemmatimonadota bacterium]